MKKTFNIYELIAPESAAETMELGDEVYKKLEPGIKECLENDEKFIIDFSDITSLTTKFLNNAIGNLILNLDYKKILNSMTFSGLDMAKKATLKWSLNTALKNVELLEKKNKQQ